MLTDGDGQGSETWEELISGRVFGQEIPPRWVLAVSRDQLADDRPSEVGRRVCMRFRDVLAHQ